MFKPKKLEMKYLLKQLILLTKEQGFTLFAVVATFCLTSLIFLYFIN